MLTWSRIAQFLADESGPTAAEYALMMGLIILVAIAAVRSLGTGNSSMWENNASKLNTAMGHW